MKCVQLEVLNVLMYRLKHGGDYLYSKYNTVAYDTAYRYTLAYDPMSTLVEYHAYISAPEIYIVW
jgi:hypothetical protein